MSHPRTHLAGLAAAAALVGGGLTAAHATATATATATTTTVTRGAPTVVAIVEPSGFNPYHYDFLGSQHPWNSPGGDPTDDIDLTADPAGYVTGYPTTTNAVTLTLPTSPTDLVAGLHAADATAWSTFQASTATDVKVNRFPGTKIIGAVSFGGSFHKSNGAHGTRSAASAVGNLHGTCPECLAVLVEGTEGLDWARAQSWIDVVTNSWEANTNGVLVDEEAEGLPVDVPVVDVRPGLDPALRTKDRVVEGQTLVWAAGNGLLNSYDAPQSTYTSGQKGPDWVVTVGATDGGNSFPGSGKPVDVSAQGIDYPSTGGLTANGTGTHRGTSNAAPVVAGTIARVIQQARDLLGDTTGGYGGGVVAEGAAPFPCGTANAGCVLSDGKLTRYEAERVVLHNVLPGTAIDAAVPTTFTAALSDPTVPTTRFAYHYVGHGVVPGHENPVAMAAAQARFRAVLRGDAVSYARPAGERAWMISDSKCRQRIWGAWGEGYWTGSEVNDGSSPLATAWDAWCTPEVAAAIRDAIP